MGCLIGFSQRSLTASADVVLQTVDLTVEQTRALYGNVIQGYYFTNAGTWQPCQWTYYQSSLDLEPATAQYPDAKTLVSDYSLDTYPAGYASTHAYADDALRNMAHLYYMAYIEDMPNLTSSHEFRFMLNTSVNISGIAYFRQNIGFSRAANWGFDTAPDCDDLFVSTNFSYSASPQIDYAFGSSNGGPTLYATGWWKTMYGDLPTDVYPVYFTNIDIYGQHTDALGNDEIFSVGNQQIQCGYMNTVQNPLYPNDSSAHRFFILSIACPRVSADYVLPGGGSSDISGDLQDINVNIQGTNSILADILAELDLIYAHMDNTVTVNISSSSISGIGSAIRNLFVPSASSWTAFKMSMHSLLQAKFSSFFDAEETVHDFYSAFDDVSAVSTVRFPGVSLDLPTGSGSEVATFSIAAQDVDLKPANESGKFAPLYDCLALIIDFVCTLAVINMIRTRFFHIIEGGGENDY